MMLVGLQSVPLMLLSMRSDECRNFTSTKLVATHMGLIAYFLPVHANAKNALNCLIRRGFRAHSSHRVCTWRLRGFAQRA